MKYRMISASALPLALGVAGGVTLKKPGDSAEVELSPRAAERIARHGAVRFEAVSEPAPVPKLPEPKREEPEPAAPMAFAPASLTPFEITTETPPLADAGAATE